MKIELDEEITCFDGKANCIHNQNKHQNDPIQLMNSRHLYFDI